MSIPITLACWSYDRTEALRSGAVTVAGVDLTYLDLPVEETFFRMLRYHSFDVAELSLSSYVMTLGDGAPPFVAIPVFPSRAFRHSCIFINRRSGISSPKDLIGKVVGIPEYQMTAAVWIRGTLAEHFGVPVDSVEYRTGGLESSGRTEKLPLHLPDTVRVGPIGPSETLAGLLATGTIDALYTTRAPSSYTPGRGDVVRLWQDSRSIEAAYFRATRIFPIMHVVAIRRDVHERHPWLAAELYKAFEAARILAMANLTQTSALMHSLPWLAQEVESTRTIMGRDFWTYGLEANLEALSTFLKYSYAQGLAARLFEPRELFVASTHEQYVI